MSWHGRSEETQLWVTCKATILLVRSDVCPGFSQQYAWYVQYSRTITRSDDKHK